MLLILYRKYLIFQIINRQLHNGGRQGGGSGQAAHDLHLRRVPQVKNKVAKNLTKTKMYVFLVKTRSGPETRSGAGSADTELCTRRGLRG